MAYKETLLKKIEQTVRDIETYRTNALITIGGIDLEEGRLRRLDKMDHPSDVDVGEFLKNILYLYTADDRFVTLCELYLQLSESDEQTSALKEMIQSGAEDKSKCEKVILEHITLGGKDG